MKDEEARFKRAPSTGTSTSSLQLSSQSTRHPQDRLKPDCCSRKNVGANSSNPANSSLPPAKKSRKDRRGLGLFGNVSIESNAECHVVGNERKIENTRIQMSVNAAPMSRQSPTSTSVTQSTKQRRT